MKSLIKKILFGTDIPQEYLCLAENGISNPLQIIFTSGNYKADVTDSNLFLGYKPVIIGIVSCETVNSKTAKLKFNAANGSQIATAGP